jgi:predicted  nucleic acid-binding Zn-ribbon protein
MNWKRARDGWSQGQAVNDEKKAVSAVTAQLKQELSDHLARNNRVKDELKRVNDLWSTIESPSDPSRQEFVSLRAKFYESSQEMMQLIAQHDDELHEVARRIAGTRKANYAELLPLFTRMQELICSKLENERGRREELVAFREQAIDRLRVLAEAEATKSAL